MMIPLDDSALFVEQAAWLAPHLTRPTIGGFACWLAPWLRGASKHSLEVLYRINHPEHQRAEAALVALLAAEPEKANSRQTISDQCGRNVDWPSTLALAHQLSPTRFVEQNISGQDRGLLAGLATIAREWSWLLTEYGGLTDTDARVRRLRLAARYFGHGPLTTAHLRRLGRVRGMREHAAHLCTALELMSAPMNTAQARTALVELGKELRRSESAELENCADALEVSVILSIARAAQSLGWRVAAAEANLNRPKPILRLSQGNLRCAISKAAFEYPARPGHRAADALASLERSGLGLESTGRQPDVVISFWHLNAPHDVFFCIADAKRNAKHDGVAYLKKSITAMAAYMAAFAEPLRAQLSSRFGGFFAPIMPAATLFVTQRPSAGKAQRYRGKPGRRKTSDQSWLECLDSRDYALIDDDGCWQGARVAEWFTRISQSAVRAMSATSAGGRT